MFILNFKVNGKKLWKIALVILIILIVALFIFVGLKIFNNAKVNSISSKDSEVLEITSEEYTNFLKASHDNINNYLGKKIKIVGYVYRLPDFSSNEFVVARTMIMDNNTAVVVGIFSECNNASKYDTGSWIEVTGTIKKGNYNGEIPILEISNIKTIKAPEDEFVYMPVD